MAIRDKFIKELEEESAATRKMLERIPADKFSWKPHDKSMSMGQLATLVADMFGWPSLMVDHDELDFAKGYKQAEPKTTEELAAYFEKRLTDGLESLGKAEDDIFSQPWKLRNAEQIYWEAPKWDVIRQTINHMAHHRGQLSVYMRLNDIPVPSIYGPTADDATF